jgi:hypothetical protein
VASAASAAPACSSRVRNQPAIENASPGLARFETLAECLMALKIT